MVEREADSPKLLEFYTKNGFNPRMRLTICRRMGYNVFIASASDPVGCRIAPSVATPNFNPDLERSERTGCG